jgi:hypothetical protein
MKVEGAMGRARSGCPTRPVTKKRIPYCVPGSRHFSGRPDERSFVPAPLRIATLTHLSEGFCGEAIDNAALVGFLVGEFLDPNNVTRNENGLIVRGIRDGDIDRCHLVIALATFETDSSPGHVFAGDNVVGEAGTTNASLIG